MKVIQITDDAYKLVMQEKDKTHLAITYIVSNAIDAYFKEKEKEKTK